MKTIDRREFLRLAAAGAVSSAGLLASTQRSWAEQENVVVISSWGGILQEGMRKAYFDPFTKETGIKVIENNYGAQGLAKLRAQIEAGRVEVDILDGLSQWPLIGSRQGVIDRIDTKYFDKANLVPGMIQEHGFRFMTFSSVITYNTKAFPKRAPRTWADFWDAKAFPGRRGMWGATVSRHVEYALMADGIPPEQVNPLSMEKVERAFKKLDQVKPHISVWYPGTSQAQQLLADEEVVLAEFLHARTAVLARQGLPLAFDFNQGIANYATWILAKNAPHKENALKLLGYISQPKPQAEMMLVSYYGPINTKAFDLIKDDAVLRLAPTFPDNLKKQVLFDAEWWGEHEEKLAERWRAWIAAK